MIYYKVIQVCNEQKFSVADHNFQLTYSTEEFTYPHPDLPGSKIFVFDSLENAVEFLIHISWELYSDFEIWTCETKGEPQEFEEVAGLFYVTEFWYYIIRKLPLPSDFYLQKYKGTIGVDAVKLLEQVSYDTIKQVEKEINSDSQAVDSSTE